MKLLHTVEFYSPSVGGAQEVVRQISEKLAGQGHEVTVATTRLLGRRGRALNGVKIREFEISGNEVRGIAGDVAAYEDFLHQWDGDVMLNYAAQQWATDIAFRHLSDLPYRKVLAPCGFSALHDLAYASYFMRLPKIMRLYDRIVFHSSSYRDVEFARRHGIKEHTVIPNGASEEEFDGDRPSFRARYDISDKVPLLLTVGTHTGTKGHALAIEAFRRARIGKAVLVVAANVPDGGGGCEAECLKRAREVTRRSLGRKRVLVASLPREEVVAAYQAADLFVFGSSIECSPIVLFEALAARTPFVSVGCGNAAEIASWTSGGAVIPTTTLTNGEVHGCPDDMAQALERLIPGRGERERMAEAGHQAWRERFTWERLATQYGLLYQSLL